MGAFCLMSMILSIPNINKHFRLTQPGSFAFYRARDGKKLWSVYRKHRVRLKKCKFVIKVLDDALELYLSNFSNV